MKILGASAFVAPANLAPAVGRSQPVPSPSVSEGGFGDVLSQMMKNVDESLRSAERLSVGALTGEVPLQKVVETVVAAEQTVQLTTAVRDKIVAAYVELTRMPI
ncbi:MAG: flagellar hook-basal body complex protein FliE [Hyphomicrobium sp.]|nr:flagellar hook-basal body complex protein FliE [Hyphomicrobium sp.]